MLNNIPYNMDIKRLQELAGINEWKLAPSAKVPLFKVGESKWSDLLKKNIKIIGEPVKGLMNVPGDDRYRSIFLYGKFGQYVHGYSFINDKEGEKREWDGYFYPITTNIRAFRRNKEKKYVSWISEVCLAYSWDDERFKQLETLDEWKITSNYRFNKDMIIQDSEGSTIGKILEVVPSFNIIRDTNALKDKYPTLRITVSGVEPGEFKRSGMNQPWYLVRLLWSSIPNDTRWFCEDLLIENFENTGYKFIKE